MIMKVMMYLGIANVAATLLIFVSKFCMQILIRRPNAYYENFKQQNKRNWKYEIKRTFKEMFRKDEVVVIKEVIKKVEVDSSTGEVLNTNSQESFKQNPSKPKQSVDPLAQKINKYIKENPGIIEIK